MRGEAFRTCMMSDWTRALRREQSGEHSPNELVKVDSHVSNFTDGPQRTAMFE